MRLEHVIGLILVAVIFQLTAACFRALELVYQAPIHEIFGLAQTGGGRGWVADADAPNVARESRSNGDGKAQTHNGEIIADIGLVNLLEKQEIHESVLPDARLHQPGSVRIAGPEYSAGLSEAHRMRSGSVRVSSAALEGKSTKDIILGVSRCVDDQNLLS